MTSFAVGGNANAVHVPQDATTSDLRTAVLKVALEAPEKSPRTCPPRACTSAAQVGVALSDAMELAAIYRTQVEILRLARQTTDPREIELKLRQLKVGAEGQVERAGRLVGFLDETQARLAHAEAIQDWDDLRGEEPTGTEIAYRIRQCLDDIGNKSADDTDVADARDDLAVWFANYDFDVLLGKTIADVLGKKRIASLKAEREMWQRARVVASA
jgi:hypothetical protein